jgi:hypothetical protein
VLGYPMERGVAEAYDRLAELLGPTSTERETRHELDAGEERDHPSWT